MVAVSPRLTVVNEVRWVRDLSCVLPSNSTLFTSDQFAPVLDMMAGHPSGPELLECYRSLNFRTR